MCFSAPASFAVAALTGAIGVATLGRVGARREIPLAAIPLVFSAQQIIEGLLWLLLPSGEAPALSHALAFAFLVFAQVVWPVLVPAAVILVESERRRRLFLVLLAIGVLVGLTSLASLVAAPVAASIVNHSIQYTTGFPYLTWWRVPYILATVVPLFLSSHRPVQALGLLVSVGYAVSAYFYVDTFLSVWCFFAAGASAILLFQFVRGFAPLASRAPLA